MGDICITPINKNNKLKNETKEVVVITKYNKKPWWNRVDEKEIQKTIDEVVEYTVKRFEKLLKRLNGNGVV